VAAALDLFRARPALGFSDCLVLQLARKAGHLPLGTFDRGLCRGRACPAPTGPTLHAASSPRSTPARDRG
jgi:hypothetical protein